MKYLKEEISGKEERRRVFAIGDHETMLVMHALINAYRWTPNTVTNRLSRRRIQSMIRTLRPFVLTIEKKYKELGVSNAFDVEIPNLISERSKSEDGK